MTAKSFVTMNKNGINITYVAFSLPNGIVTPGLKFSKPLMALFGRQPALQIKV